MRRAACAVGLAAAALGVATAPASAASILVVGDSLSVGTTPYLRQQLADDQIASDGRVGRPSGEAVSVLRSKLSASTDVVVFDAGVNDDPSQPSRLANDLNAVGQLAGDRCLVIATVSRPPYKGVSVSGLNAAVTSFAGGHSNVQLVDWRGFATQNDSLISRDGVHPRPAGYQARATLFADAIDSCGTTGGGSGGGGGGGGSGGDDDLTVPPATGGDDEQTQEPDTPPATPREKKKQRAERKRKQRERRRRRKPPVPLPDPGDQLQLIESVTFNSRGARLAGEILPPDGGGAHPAVVLIPGDGAIAGRDNYRDAATALAERGIEAMIYDRRGSGESTGAGDATYSELAADAHAAVGFLRRRADVRPGSVAIWGFGQGGSVAPIVAAGDPKLAAVALASPAALSTASQHDWETRRRLKDKGIDGGTAAATRYYGIEAGAHEDDLGYDPTADWRRVGQPVLAIWGESDRVTPTRSNAAALAAALARGPNRDRTFRTLEGATHELGVDTTGDALGTAPGFLDESVEWLHAHLTVPRAAATVDTPLPPPDPPVARRVEPASVLDHWPVQIAWLLLPALALAPFAARGVWRLWRAPPGEMAIGDLRLPVATVVLDAVVLFTVAYAVAALVDDRGRGVDALAGLPAPVFAAWMVTAGAVVATAGLAVRSWRRRIVPAVPVASAVWLLLAVYWLA